MQWSVDDVRYEVINEVHERALIFMSKMPRIWIDYCQFLIEQRLITKTREVFDKALQSLPVTQHDKIWPIYIDWVTSLPLIQTALKVYKRYLKLNPDAREDFVLYLISNEQYEEAVRNLIILLDDDLFHSKKGKTKFDYWIILCNLIANYPDNMKHLDCESIIRHGLNKYTDEVGRLWVSLANFYIKQGLFDRARDIFEEALTKVSTARDFSLIFNSYLKFEEELINSLIKLKEEEELQRDLDSQIESLVEFSFNSLGLDTNKDLNGFNKSHEILKEDKTSLDMNMKFFKMTNLIERRPFLLSDAILRQNPHNVKEWSKRIKLCYHDSDLTIKTFEKALNTIDPQKAFGRLELLWINYAKHFEELDDLSQANSIFFRATKVNFKNTDAIATIWCEWAEMQLRCNNYFDAYIIAKTACSQRSDKSKGKNASHSLRVWSLYVDLEEHLGTIENVKSIYQRMIDLKIANTETVFNFCYFLEQNMYYEETFRVYEQAISYFVWPQAYDIWLIYLTKFVERYQGTKIERARDLFEQVLSVCPKDKIKIFYYMYAELEEKYGLLNHCIRILDKACCEVVKEDKTEIYSVLISKTANFFGVTKTRVIFTRALEILDADQILDIGMKFAMIEQKLGEIPRSRAIFTHLSQFCDPSKPDCIESFWKIWEEFETTHGNEDTFSEMMRTKRSVSSRFSLNAPLFVVESKVPV